MNRNRILAKQENVKPPTDSASVTLIVESVGKVIFREMAVDKIS